MTILFFLGLGIAPFIPFWWIKYPDIVFDVMAFREEWWFGILMWIIHAWIPFAIYFIAQH